MSDAVTVVDAPTEAAPAIDVAAAPAPEAVVAPTPQAEQPAGPMSREQARRAAREDARGRMAENTQAPAPVADAATAPQPVVDEHGRVRDPITGQFRPATGDVSTSAAPGSPNAPSAGQATPGSPGIRIELPADHPLRGMGLDALEATSPAQERAMRALLNGSYARVNELQAEKAARQAAEQRLLRLESQSAAAEKWKATPEYTKAVEEYEAILDAAGQAAASKYWKGVQADLQALVDQEYGVRMSETEAQGVETAANQWSNEAWQHASQLPQEIRSLPNFPRWFHGALVAFNAEIEAGMYDQVLQPGDAEGLHREFAKSFGARLMRENEVAAIYRARAHSDTRQQAEARAAQLNAQRERDRIAQEAVEAFKRTAAGARSGQPLNPLAGIGGAERVAGAQPPETVNLEGMSPSEVKRALRTAARGDADRRFNTTR